MNKKLWKKQVYDLLCKSQGKPKNPSEAKNLRDWAKTIWVQAASDAQDLKCEIITPQEAHDEEMAAV